MILVLFYNYI